MLHMDQAMRAEEALASPSSTPPLESLPFDILVNVLQATARSTADLHALICASPAACRVFLSAKRTVLLAILDWDLGPALRDAIAATVLAPGRLDAEEANKATQLYAALPPPGVGARVLANGLSDEAIYTVVKTNQSVQFFIDQFAARRAALAKVHPDAAGPLTPSERWRLAQALLRHQFVTRIEPGPRQSVTDAMRFLRPFFALFKPWELTQLSDMHSFVCGVVARVFAPRRHWAGRLHLNFYNTGPLDRDEYAALRDLRTLHTLFLQEGTGAVTEPTLLAEFDSFSQFQMGYGLGRCFDFLAAGPLPSRSGINRVAIEAWGLRDDMYRRENAMPPLVHAGDHDDASPPFGWVDAHDGLDCQSWGTHIFREVPPPDRRDFSKYQANWVCWRLTQWRWLGFTFWDKNRVEILKTRLPLFSTGWLTSAPPPWQDCRVEMRRLPMSKRRRACAEGRPRRVVDENSWL